MIETMIVTATRRSLALSCSFHVVVLLLARCWLLVVGGAFAEILEGSLPSARASYVFKIIIKYFWFSFSENLMTSQRQIANKGGLKNIERELEIENKGGRERGEGQNIMSVCPKT
jgi:hypothetical protein